MENITTLLRNKTISRPSEYQRNPGWGPDGERRDSLRFFFLGFGFAVLMKKRLSLKGTLVTKEVHSHEKSQFFLDIHTHIREDS